MTFLASIERLGRKLPHPTLAFVGLCGLIIIVSHIFSLFGVEAVHPVDGKIVQAKSLMSQTGLAYILAHTVDNFMAFAPLGPVLVAMLGIGLADHSGYLPKAVELFVERAPGSMLSYAMVFTGVLSNLAADAGYVVLIPLAAVIFQSFGRHPLAGIAAAFAGVSGGYSANLLIGPADIILTGITLEAAKIVEPSTLINVTSNYWFLAASTFLVTGIGGLVTDRIIEPYLSHQKDIPETWIRTPSTTGSKSAFTYATLAGLLYIMSMSGLLFFSDLTLKQALSGLVVLISLGFAIPGLVYGWLRPKNNYDNINTQESWIVASMEKTFTSLAGYLVLMFFAAQFVAYFNWTELGLIAAITGADILSSLSIPTAILLLFVVILSAVINLLIGSASAKWALIAPVFVPMLMLLDLDPAYTQLAYRIGDSSTNIITPLMPYFALVLAYAQQYQKSAHLGTIMAMMIPYSLSFLLAWLLMLGIWTLLALPIGF